MSDQIRALDELKLMAASYGFDISRPARTAQEAIQWTYFGYLGAIKDQNGAAMSIGRISTFLDVYIDRDMAAGLLAEEEAQELIDDLVIKLRIVRFLRTPDYNELFTGDPVDYACNTLARGYPRGLDVEVFSRAALEEALYMGLDAVLLGKVIVREALPLEDVEL